MANILTTVNFQPNTQASFTLNAPAVALVIQNNSNCWLTYNGQVIAQPWTQGATYDLPAGDPNPNIQLTSTAPAGQQSQNMPAGQCQVVLYDGWLPPSSGVIGANLPVLNNEQVAAVISVPNLGIVTQNISVDPAFHSLILLDSAVGPGTGDCNVLIRGLTSGAVYNNAGVGNGQRIPVNVNPAADPVLSVQVTSQGTGQTVLTIVASPFEQDVITGQTFTISTIAELEAFIPPGNAGVEKLFSINHALEVIDVLANATTFGGLPPLSNAKYVPIVGANLPTGDNDLYTVPANRKALILPTRREYNPSVGNITSYPEIKVGGVYWQMNVSATNASGAGSNPSFQTPIVLNAGESFSMNCATTAGLNVRGLAVEFDAWDTHLNTARILGLANGNNTLLTVPAGSFIVGTNALSIANPSNVDIFNGSGGALNYIVYDVPAAGAPGATNQLYPATNINNGNSAVFVAGASLQVNDSIVVNTSGGGAGQWAWVTYFQLP